MKKCRKSRFSVLNYSLPTGWQKLVLALIDYSAIRQEGSASAQFLPAMLDQFGAEAGGDSTKRFGAFIKAEQVKGAKVIKEKRRKWLPTGEKINACLDRRRCLQDAFSPIRHFSLIFDAKWACKPMNTCTSSYQKHSKIQGFA